MQSVTHGLQAAESVGNPPQSRQPNLVVPLFCIAAVVINHSVFRLGAMSPAWAALLVTSIVAVAIAAPHLSLGAVARPPLAWRNVAFGAVILAPLLTAFALGWNRDFPFSGDHYFHIGQSYRIAFWWLSSPGTPVVRVPGFDEVQALLRHPTALLGSRFVLLAAITAGTVAIYRFKRRLALGFVVVSIVGWAFCESTIFLRYPAGGYFAALPFLGIAQALHEFELSGRIANVLAPVLWLFALRPWLIGRWPDLCVAPLALLLFWQKDVIYYFNSVYLEPWALVFCLLAIEVLVARGPRGASLACLLIGAAAVVKETAILALPLVWLAGAPWRRPLRRQVALTGAAVSAGTAFVLYYAARKSVAAEIQVEASRDIRFAFPGRPFSAYLGEFTRRFEAAYSLAPGLCLLAAFVALGVMIWWLPSRRLQLWCLAMAGSALVAIFLVDANSVDLAGYFRFFLASLPFFAAGVLALGYVLPRKAGVVLAAVVLVLQSPSAFDAVRKAAGPTTGLNFIENDEAAIFFPMKSLVAEARGMGLLSSGETVLAAAPDAMVRPIPGIPVSFGPPGALTCECSAQHPVVMSLFVHYANLAASRADPDTLLGGAGLSEERERVWRSDRAQRPLCLAKLRQSCGHVLERNEDGDLVGLLGSLR